MAITCQRCGKVAATVHLTDLMQEERRERHLCSDCAETEGVILKPSQGSLNEVLTQFVKQKAAVQELVTLACDQCGMTFVEFRSQGLLGCPNDYDAFRKALDPLIERSHEGASQHVGKAALRAGAGVKTRQERLRLERELQQAVDHEQYEKAAQLRDQIKQLESS